jgi:putative ABC transport system ATP-binding protein
MSVVIDNACVSLFTKTRRIDVLNNFSVPIKEQEFVAITGPSGSDKSTILNAIAGALKVRQGTITVFGREVTQMNEEQLAEHRAGIGFIFQNYYLFPRLSVWYNVALPMLIKGIPANEVKTRALELLASMGLKNNAFNLAMELSGGEQQRVAIARALANKPPLILADEPTGNLDRENSNSSQNIFKRLSENGITIIVATHDLNFAKQADRIIELV